MKVKNILFGMFWLIVIYLFATRGAQINMLFSTMGDYALKGTALLQGRDKVKGVTV